MLSVLVALTALLPLTGASAGPAHEDVTGGSGPAARTAGAARTAPEPGAGSAAPAGDLATGTESTGTDGTGTESTGGESTGDDSTSSPSSSSEASGPVAAARCGPELSSTDGIEAQTCVLTQGDQTWARTYYRNETGRELISVLTLMVPDGQTVQMHCAVAAGDTSGTCETPRERTTGDAAAYAAVAEFAATGAAPGSQEAEPLLLRSGSDEPARS
ncbi:hypothetical protein [Streptomyces himalayensis]|uniref:hypothetical protein n=1 Tax=Streptomyces himalayensis TaxID=2820085 RepID=UPI0028A6E0FC|nr:hypothetical protein [Streptomyces himalayensis]